MKKHRRFIEKIAPCRLEDRWEGGPFDGYAIAVMMHGQAVSPGMATGRAIVVRGKDDMDRIRDGAVIVSRVAAHQLVNAMPKACALVMEKEGQGGVASGIARKYGIPAVAGVPGLIMIVQDGGLIHVDGSEGKVEMVLKRTLR